MTSTAPRSRTSSRAGDSLLTRAPNIRHWVPMFAVQPSSRSVIPLACVDDKMTGVFVTFGDGDEAAKILCLGPAESEGTPTQPSA